MNKTNALLFILIALASLLLTITIPARENDPVLQCKPEERAFLEKEYDVAVKEIEIRIEEEHDLFLQKIVFVGAVLGSVFFSKVVRPLNGGTLAPVMVVCCWAAVAVAAIMDVRLMFNNIIIGDRGKWIRALEKIFLTGEGQSAGWENFYKHNSILWQSPQASLVFTDRQLLTSGLFILALFLSSFPTEHHAREHFKLFKLAASCCLVLIAWPGLYEHVSWLQLVCLPLGVIFIILWKPPVN